MGVLGAIGIGLTATAGIASGLSSYQAGRYNAKVYEQQAQAALRANEFNERIQRRQFERLKGAQVASAAASGIEFTGSPLAVQISSIFEFESDVLNRRYNAEVQASQARSAAKQAKQRGAAALLGSVLQAGASAFVLGSLLGPGTPGATITTPFGEKVGVDTLTRLSG